MNKPSDQRSRMLVIILTGVSLVLWCYLFRLFLNGSAPLEGDAHPYLGHVRFYLENITRGVYPLWNPIDTYGNVNEFFLRRIGEFNPFFWTIVFLTKSGVPFLIAYRLFLVAYFFMGIAGFYLLSRQLFGDRLASFTAALLLLFSCIGASTFESFLLLEIVPFIWFSYFLVAFMKAPQKVFLLGAVFSLMVINITYIPFYFYTILFIFLICFFTVYGSRIGVAYRQVGDFIGRHKVFPCLCAVILVVSFIPGILWYQQTRQGEALTMQRHNGSQDVNSTSVSINKVNEGGIIPNFIFDRQFVDLDMVGLHDFYVPLFAYLMLLAGVWGRLNRRLVVFFVFGFMIFLIGLADASYLHRFLYDHVSFFKYFRNVQFFLWFAILPVFILFVVEQMLIFIEDCRQSRVDRKWMTVWVVMVHVFAVGLFLFKHVGCLTYAVIIFNLAWMLGRIWSVGSSRAWVLLLWGAIILQPFEVYSHIAVDYPPGYQHPYAEKYVLSPISLEDGEKTVHFKKRSKTDMFRQDLPYFSTRWLYEAMGSIDGKTLENYLGASFIVYDRVEMITDKSDPARLRASLARFDNIAFVYTDTAQGGDGLGLPKARVITAADKDFEVLKFDANDVVVRTSFTKPCFLVRTQNYHSQWRAFIDGKPAELLRTNICVQGLWVPAGEHVVRWQFGTPARYVLAYFLVVLYPFVLIGLIWLWFRSRASIQKLPI